MSSMFLMLKDNRPEYELDKQNGPDLYLFFVENHVLLLLLPFSAGWNMDVINNLDVTALDSELVQQRFHSARKIFHNVMNTSQVVYK